jgi:hypothetical protein
VFVLGWLLVVVAVVIYVGDGDGLSRRMPTQVPPRALAPVPLLMGCLLIAASLF